MKNYVQDGNTVTVPAPANVVAGQGVLVGDLFGVAMHDAASGALVEIRVTGVVTLRKAAGTINPGVRVFWDPSVGRVTTTPSGNRCIGYHVGTTANTSGVDSDILVLLRPNTPVGT